MKPAMELEGAELDAAVAKAEGYLPAVMFATDEGEPAALWMPHPTLPHFPLADWSPSTRWCQGGPIIERERVYPVPQWGTEEWVGWWYKSEKRHSGIRGPTPLIAAMRAYVASKTAA